VADDGAEADFDAHLRRPERRNTPWTGPPPTVGTIARFVVDRHLDATHRILLRST
jgi:hypothetical protein